MILIKIDYIKYAVFDKHIHKDKKYIHMWCDF